MSEKFQALLNLAVEVENAPDNTLKAALLADKVLRFSEEHVIAGTMLKSGVVVDVLMPLESPLRNGIAKIVSAQK